MEEIKKRGRGRPKKPTDEEMKVIEKLVADGAVQEHCAYIYGVHYSTVSKRLKAIREENV